MYFFGLDASFFLASFAIRSYAPIAPCLPGLGGEDEVEAKEATVVPGIYLVNFGQPGTAADAKGVAVIEGKRVHGGDQSNVYRGRIEGDADSLRADIRVTNHSGLPDTIFGPLKEFDLKLSGEEVEGTFRLHGHIVGRPELKIRISGTWQQGLVD